MADPKAEATSNKKDKSSILDDAIGNDILNSWNLISVIEDTGDFKLEPMGKSKKKDFKFGKMDMDFNLGGDFGKLSSFKMDMSDLDFSFPSKKNTKATETTERDSSRVNIQGKEDRFNFSFDFDNFDIDAALSKIDTLSSKEKEIQKHVTEKTDIEVPDVQDIEVTIANAIKNPKKGQTSDIMDAVQLQVLGDNHDTLMAGKHSLRYDTSVDIVLQPGAEIASNKAVHDARENAVDRSYLPVDGPIIQEHNDHSMLSNLGVGCLMEPPEEGCYSGKIVNVNVGGEKISCYEAPADAVQPKSPEFVLPQIAERLEDNTSKNKILSDSNDVCIEELVGPGSDHGGSPKIVQRKISELSSPKIVQSKISELSSPKFVHSKISELLQDNNVVNGVASKTSADFMESSDGVAVTHDASVASAVKIQHGAMKTQLSPLSSRGPVGDKSPLGKEKELKLARLKFLSKLGEADNPNHESSVSTKPKPSNVIVTHSNCMPETREATAHEKPTGLTAEGGFVSHKKITKGEHTLLRNQRTLISPKENSLSISLSKSVEMSNKNESQKSDKANIISTTDCTQSGRYISTGKDKSLPLKSVTKNLALTDLKSSRWAAEKKLQSISATTNEIKSFKDLKQKVVEDVIVTPKVAVHSLTEKQKKETPSLKRKQAPNAGLVHEIPLKRLSQSPKDSSISNVSDLKIQEQVQDKTNTMDINVSSHSADVPKILKFDAPGQMNSSVLDIPSEIDDFGMVEKAAAYGKDLDDLCNMLKKKNEEAKELLVRAVINNNSLLLLNHPMNEEKIRSVQKLANRLMALEIVPPSEIGRLSPLCL